MDEATMKNIASLYGNIYKIKKSYVLEIPTKYDGISEKSDIITPKSKASMVFLGDQSILYLIFKQISRK